MTFGPAKIEYTVELTLSSKAVMTETVRGTSNFEALYQALKRNMHRHIVKAEIKETKHLKLYETRSIQR